MGEMIERVARAIWIQSGFGPEGFKPDGFYASPYMGKACAAIEAMREPTETMLTAARERRGQQSYDDIWRDMIDAILSEK